MSEDYEFDDDVLAVLKRGDATITFIVAPSSALDGEDFDIVLWDESAMVLAVSEEYMNEEIDEFVINKIMVDLEGLENDDLREAVSDNASKYMGLKLSEILREAISSTSVPYDSNLSASLRRVLDEG
jgi:hypothetical protein